MDKRTTNICKGIAIILMYFHHLYYSLDTIQQYEIFYSPFTMNTIIWIAEVCKVCVSIFVFLTGYGYVMSGKSGKEDIKTKSVRRCFRLMFGFWFIFIVAQLTSGLGRSRIEVYGEDLFQRIFCFIIDGLGLANCFGTPTFNATWWYVPYAILLIFVTPFIIKVVQKYGWISIIVAIMLPKFLLGGDSVEITFWRYLLALVLGIYCAEFSVFQRISAFVKKKKLIVPELMILSIGGIILCVIRQKIGMYYVVEPILAMVVCYISYRYISRIRGLRAGLSFLGKHSMNLFLMHTFIKAYYFADFTYSFRYWWLILLVLIADTLAISILIEYLKKLIRYNRAEKMANEKVLKILSFIEYKK